MPYEYKHLVKLLKETHIASPLLAISWNGVYGQSGNVTFIGRNLLKDQSSLLCEVMHKSIGDFCLYTIINKDFAIFNIHLDDESYQRRSKQIKEIVELEGLHKHVIIGGDFNQAYRPTSKLYNIKNYKISNKDCITYYNEKTMNIDNIMVKGFNIEYKTLCPYIPETKTYSLIYYGSDHIPIITNIIMK